MPVLPNAKHERFAAYLAEGKSTGDAYVLAGFKDNQWKRSAASQLLNRKPEIRERAIQISAEHAALAAKSQAITKEVLIQWHNDIRKQGMTSGQLAPAETAIKEISVLTGHRIERQEVGGPGEYEALADADLERELSERIEQLGLGGSGSETQH